MRPDLGPTACLSFEPDEARCLLWLPLAVRHKLDGCRLRLSLLEWQALPLDTRAELLHLPAGADFALCALQAGASRDTRLRQPVRLEACEIAQALDCDAAAARCLARGCDVVCALCSQQASQDSGSLSGHAHCATARRRGRALSRLITRHREDFHGEVGRRIHTQGDIT